MERAGIACALNLDDGLVFAQSKEQLLTQTRTRTTTSKPSKRRHGLIISVAKDKTNKKGRLRKVSIQGSGSAGCPIKIVKDWIQRAPEFSFVFRKLTDPTRPIEMSYEMARKDWTQLAQKHGLSPGTSLHNFRGSAATHAIKDFMFHV